MICQAFHNQHQPHKSVNSLALME